MPLFRFKAVTSSGGVTRGQIEAPDRATAAARLQAQGHVPLTVEVVAESVGLRGLLSREVGGPRRSRSRLVPNLIGRLSLLLDAGINLETALALLTSSEGETLTRGEADQLLRRLRAGAGLADAMAARPQVFSPIVVSMVRAGEISGMLAPTLSRLAGHLDRAEAVRQSIRSALIYPAVLLATATGSVLLVLLVVLPQLEPVFADMGDRLPWLTRLAFSASHLIQEGWWAILLFALIGFLVGRLLWSKPEFRSHLDGQLLRVPLLGSTLRKAEAARFARVLGTLVSGGILLSAALSLTKPVVANRAIGTSLAKVADAVRAGSGLAGPISRHGIFPELAVHMIRIGEETGRLDAMLIRLADLLEADVQKVLNRAIALLVPLLTILLGALVAGIIASVMLAVLGVNDLIR